MCLFSHFWCVDGDNKIGRCLIELIYIWKGACMWKWQEDGKVKNWIDKKSGKFPACEGNPWHADRPIEEGVWMWMGHLQLGGWVLSSHLIRGLWSGHWNWALLETRVHAPLHNVLNQLNYGRESYALNFVQSVYFRFLNNMAKKVKHSWNFGRWSVHNPLPTIGISLVIIYTKVFAQSI